MKYYTKKLVTLILLLMLAFTMVTPATTQAATQKYTISVKKKTVKKKKTVSVKSTTRLRVKDGKKTVKPTKVKFKSSNKKVATISRKGVIKAKKVGKTTISIRYKNKTAKIKLFVIKPVKSVSLSKHTLTLNKGETKKLKASVLPSNATNKGVTWSSSNKNIATVSKDGTVTGKNAGTTTITATSNQGKKEDECDVTIKNEENKTENNTSDTTSTVNDSAKVNEDKTISIDGITFNVTTDGMLSVGEPSFISGEITITTDKPIDTKQIKTVVNNGNCEVRGVRNEDNGPVIDVPSFSNSSCLINETFYEKKIHLTFVRMTNKIEFPVSIYYKNTLISNFYVKVLGIDQGEIDLRNKVKSIESKVWVSPMSVPDKIEAIADYIAKTYTYDECDCKDGAEILFYAAHDLGLKPWYGFTYYYENGLVPSIMPDGSYGIDYYRNYYSPSSPAGHTILAYEYNGEIHHTAAEGHH